MKKEIGSYFWDAETSDKPFTPFGGIEAAYVMSGRTALDYILRDIKSKKRIRRAYLPSYCCDTMMVPFLQHGIEVCFYDVVYNEHQLQVDVADVSSGDIGLVIQYFGFQDNSATTAAEFFSARGMTVIEDCTHSLFCRSPYNRFDDYIFAVFTKWTGVECGAAAACLRGGFSLPAPIELNAAYNSLKTEAMKEKSDYMNAHTGSKDYLTGFKKAEVLLGQSFANFGPGEDAVKKIQTLDAEFIRSRRRENAELLMAGLKECRELEPICPTLGDTDCPLFVPVYVKDNRDGLRQYLTDNSVYLPVHWPVSGHHQLNDRRKLIYEHELSLVCDQRYDATDMKAVLDRIQNYFDRQA